MERVEIQVPDLGGDGEATVVELLVQPGETVQADDPLVAVETDKATSEIPTTSAGTVVELYVELNAKVGSGDRLALIEVAGEAASATDDASVPPVAERAESGAGEEVEVRLPDLGGGSGVVVEWLLQEGEEVGVDQPLLAIETDKATAEVPSPCAGVLQQQMVKIGQTVSEGELLAKVSAAADAAPTLAPPPPPTPPPSASSPPPSAAPTGPKPEVSRVADVSLPLGGAVHASPMVRKLARELAAPLKDVPASGPNGRITLDDVKNYVKKVLQQSQAGVAATAPMPDFSKFGEVEEQKLSGIKKATGVHLSASWRTVPLVTHFEESDITELEQFRRQLNSRPLEGLAKTTPLAFIIKAVVKALQKFPAFNSSFDPDGPKLVLKHYYHIGVAVETPKGLVVPVLRDADKLTLDQVSLALKEVSGKARAGKLGREDMEGGSFTISSLGGLGGVNFTPLVNQPEVAILGVARSATKPVWNGQDFAPRLILPFSLSYDHRVIDGAEAARFCSFLAQILQDLRYLLV